MTKLTDEQKASYIHSGGLKCLFCGSPEIEGGRIEADGPFAWQEVVCSDCDAEWQDVYILTAIDIPDDAD